MPRVPYLPQDVAEPAELVSAIRARRGGALLESDRVLLHSPAFTQGWNEFARMVREELRLDAKLRELAICGVGTLNGAAYEVEKHLPVFLASGGTPRQAAALPDFEAAARDTALFDDGERAVMQLVIEMTRSVVVSDETFSSVARQLEDDQLVVELVGTIAFYNMVSRALVALRIGHD